MLVRNDQVCRALLPFQESRVSWDIFFYLPGVYEQFSHPPLNFVFRVNALWVSAGFHPSQAVLCD